MTVTECVLILCHKVTVNKLWASSYGVGVTVLVFKEKAEKNTYCKSYWINNCKERPVPYHIRVLSHSRAVINAFLLTIAFIKLMLQE